MGELFLRGIKMASNPLSLDVLRLLRQPKYAVGTSWDFDRCVRDILAGETELPRDVFFKMGGKYNPEEETLVVVGTDATDQKTVVGVPNLTDTEDDTDGEGAIAGANDGSKFTFAHGEVVHAGTGFPVNRPSQKKRRQRARQQVVSNIVAATDCDCGNCDKAIADYTTPQVVPSKNPKRSKKVSKKKRKTNKF